MIKVMYSQTVSALRVLFVRSEFLMLYCVTSAMVGELTSHDQSVSLLIIFIGPACHQRIGTDVQTSESSDYAPSWSIKREVSCFELRRHESFIKMGIKMFSITASSLHLMTHQQSLTSSFFLSPSLRSAIKSVNMLEHAS